MIVLRYPVFVFNAGENVTLRLGSDIADRVGAGDTEVEIKGLSDDTVFAFGDISRANAVPFNLVQQAWIDESSFPGVTTLDSLYRYLSLFYGDFDCEALVSVIYFNLRP